MNNKVVMTLIAITIGLIVLANVYMPVFDDFKDTEVIRYNNTDLNYAISIDGTHSIEWSGGDTYLIDGVESSTPSNRPIFISDKFVLLWLSAPSIQVFYYDPDTGNPGRITNISALTCNIDNNNVTINYTVGETSASMTDTAVWGFIRTTNGDYSLIDVYNAPIYYNNVNQIYSVAYATNGTAFVSFNGDVTYPSGSVEFNGTKIENTNDLYSTTRTSIVVTDSNGTELSPAGVIVPKEVTGTKEPEHTYVGLLGAIPIVVILALVLLALAPVIRRY